MNTSLGNTSHRARPQGVNPFARALAETRGAQGRSDASAFPQQQFADGMPFGGQNGAMNEFGAASWEDQQRAMAEQQRLQIEEQKRERLRQTLHKQVNPVEAKDIFNARQQQVQKQIEELRHELKALVKEVADLEKDVEIAVLTDVVTPGIDGSYYLSFFQKLKEFIILLRKKIHSARTWATAMSSKKKKSKKTPGLEIGGKQHEQTATVFDRMHHERSTLYSGS